MLIVYKLMSGNIFQLQYCKKCTYSLRILFSRLIVPRPKIGNMPTHVEHLALSRPCALPETLQLSVPETQSVLEKCVSLPCIFLDEDHADIRKKEHRVMSHDQINGQEGRVGIEDQLVSAAMQISELRQQTKALNRALDSKDDEIARQDT